MELLPAIPHPSREGRRGLDLGEVLAWQRRLRSWVEASDQLGAVRRVAGADVAYDGNDATIHAAVVVLDAATLAPVETATVLARAEFPYLSGFLSLREAPPLVEAASRLRQKPDLLLVDGHGRAHPRGFGIACHLGLLLDVPTIGVAKSRLVGGFQPPGRARGSTSPLLHRGKQVGEVLRTRDGVAPVFVSVGHRISLETSKKWVLACGAGYRIPEPVRRAHMVVTALRARGRAHVWNDIRDVTGPEALCSVS